MNQPAQPIERHHDTGRSKPVKILGVTYPSITNAALSNGLSPGTLSNRLKRGVSEDKLLVLGYSGRRIVSRDNLYDRDKNWAEMARQHGVNYGTLMQRLRTGVPEEELFDENLSSDKRGLRLTIGEKTYPSIAAASRELNISTATLRTRIGGGFDGEDLLTPARRGKKGISITVCGRRYRNLAHVAESHGLSRAVVSLRYKSGKRDHDLIAAPHAGTSRGKLVTIMGTDYLSIKDAARGLGLPYQELRALTIISSSDRLDSAVADLIASIQENAA